MQILERSSMRLVTCHKPFVTWISGGILSAIALGTLGYSIGWQPSTTDLNCKRTAAQVNCQLQKTTWTGIRHQQTVRDVRLVEMRRRNRSRVIVLVTPSQEVRVSNSSRQQGTIAGSGLDSDSRLG